MKPATRRDIRRRIRGSMGKLVLEAERQGAVILCTKSGLLIRGPSGTAVVHTSSSDQRAEQAFTAQLRQAGFDL